MASALLAILKQNPHSYNGIGSTCNPRPKISTFLSNWTGDSRTYNEQHDIDVKTRIKYQQQTKKKTGGLMFFSCEKITQKHYHIVTIAKRHWSKCINLILHFQLQKKVNIFAWALGAKYKLYLLHRYQINEQMIPFISPLGFTMTPALSAKTNTKYYKNTPALEHN